MHPIPFETQIVRGAPTEVNLRAIESDHGRSLTGYGEPMRGLACLAALSAVAAAVASAAPAAHELRRCAPARAAASVTRTGTCFVGTDRADSIVGTPAGDVIYGWAGDDRLTSGPGDDRVFAGSGNDTVHSGAGDDLIDPALGNDHVYGGVGNDLIRTRGGERDWISCGPGTDKAEVDKQDVVAGDCEKVIVARGY